MEEAEGSSGLDTPYVSNAMAGLESPSQGQSRVFIIVEVGVREFPGFSTLDGLTFVYGCLRVRE